MFKSFLANFKTYHMFELFLALAAIVELCLIFPGLTVDLFKPGLGNLMKTDLRILKGFFMHFDVQRFLWGVVPNESPQKRHTFKKLQICKCFQYHSHSLRLSDSK